MRNMAKILILYVQAGHGHRKVAEAVGHELRSRNVAGLHIEVADALQYTNRLFQKSYPQIYYKMVLWLPWLWGAFFFLTDFRRVYFFVRPLRTLWNRLQSKRLRDYLKQGKFDVILFTHFFPAEVCATAKRKGEIHSKLVTIVTDVIPHAVWENPGTDYYWVMAEESRNALEKKWVRKEQIITGGIPTSPEFLRTVDRQALAQKLELKSDRLTVLFTSGSFGIGPTEGLLNAMETFRNGVQAIVVCGQNQTLLETLKKRTFSFPVVLFGFIDNMHEIMSVSNLMIAKPGGSTMCESLVKGLPMIIVNPIPGQETYNAKWLLNHRATFQPKTSGEIEKILAQIVNHQEILVSTQKAVKEIAKPEAGKKLADFVLSEIAS